MNNPLLAEWTTPFEIPPFASISASDFKAAFDTAMGEARSNLNAIALNQESATFSNTIEAMERADRALNRVAAVFFNLTSADTNDELETLQRDISPRLAAFHSETMTNRELFARVDALEAATDNAGLSEEQSRVLELYHRMFVRAGARLEGEARGRFGDIMQRLAMLGTDFSQNVMADERNWFMALDENDLKGLPASLVSATAQAAADRDMDGHVVTFSRSIIVPFLQSCPSRELRKKAFSAWVARGENEGPTDNREIVSETLALRNERARLLGFPDFSSFKLKTEMAKTPEAVRDLLMAVWEPAKASANADAVKLEALLHRDLADSILEPWDWRYYSAMRQREEHDFDEGALKPYFQLGAMTEAVFDVAGRLFGLTFVELDVDLHHPDARAWEVRRGERHMGVFIGDYFARSSKRSGAWCSSFRSQRRLDGEVRPIVINVCNFAKAPEGQSSLLTFDDASTLFHEFGHALHVLLSDVTYSFISGTRVARDFVELPSQLYEHWLETPEILTKHARHVETGKALPADLLNRLLEMRNYDQGQATVEYVASALVDLEFHSGDVTSDPMEQQASVLTQIGMPHAIVMRHATPHFQHVFSGDGYSSGYYSYMWSEVMDADAFSAFEEANDVFSSRIAESLETNIYSAGGSREPADLYRQFRGRIPAVEALLKRRGLVSA